ncbi:MAG: MoxR family ATPase [Planctomycetes bacterium]|nr:MoxR family ATPase [Planctomycetota bacterium]MBM4080099.1 MoxR family ATPase [Planctomycetota bacterium]
MPDVTPSASDVQLIEKLREGRQKMTTEIGKVIVGQHEVVDQLLTALFCGGHSLMVGVPGLAKTLMVRTIAQILDLKFNRIQFTPDLMPSDITGSDIIEEDVATGHRRFKFIPGPVFANIILADEINRTPPKTQAALLQAMEEHRVTVSGETYVLEEPFFVLATQNPIEQEGTYPLPEAQLDRFMFNIYIDYPSIPEEIQIVQTTTALNEPQLNRVLTAAEVIELRRIVRKIPVATEVVQYAVSLVSSTRPSGLGAELDWIKRYVRWGAGPRASQYLILGAKARAIIRGNYCVSHKDVQAVAPAVLRHRIITNFHAESEGIKPVDVVERLLTERVADAAVAAS